MHAVSDLNLFSPRSIIRNLFFIASAISSIVKSPSGPITII